MITHLYYQYKHVGYTLSFQTDGDARIVDLFDSFKEHEVIADNGIMILSDTCYATNDQFSCRRANFFAAGSATKKESRCRRAIKENRLSF